MEGRTNKKKKTQKQGSTGLRKKECKELKASLFFFWLSVCLGKQIFMSTLFILFFFVLISSQMSSRKIHGYF
jgi:hypothetical protein